MISSGKKFINKIVARTSPTVDQLLEKKEEFFEVLEDKRILRENEFKLHKDNHEELLDYLYDI